MSEFGCNNGWIADQFYHSLLTPKVLSWPCLTGVCLKRSHAIASTDRSRWGTDDSDSETSAAPPAPASKAISAAKAKWEGEDDDNDAPIVGPSILFDYLPSLLSE